MNLYLFKLGANILGGLLDNIVHHPKSSAQGLGVLGVIASCFFAPDHAVEIVGAVGVLWSAFKMVGKDKT